jgi:8-oxo-dGTP pyrophosphatase MutT (NUDIX family)
MADPIPQVQIAPPTLLTLLTLDDVRRALTLPDFDPIEAQLRMAPQPRPFRRENKPGNPRLAGVLILLYPVEGILTFVLMRRVEYPGVHSGQISLPGGKREDGETFEQTAVRETFEELGVIDPVDVLGALTPLYVPPSDFEIHPIVAYLPARPAWKPAPLEVAEVIEVPLAHLLDPQVKATEEWTRNDQPFVVPLYRVNEHKVWGATAAILSEFEMRLRAVLAIE